LADNNYLRLEYVDHIGTTSYWKIKIINMATLIE